MSSFLQYKNKNTQQKALQSVLSKEEGNKEGVYVKMVFKDPEANSRLEICLLGIKSASKPILAIWPLAI